MAPSKKTENSRGEKSLKLLLIGNPNVGKSVIFGALTGRYATVSNYPGTTVEVSRGPAKLKGSGVELIDSPGINSLVPMSEDEAVTRDILLDEEVTSVLQVLDSKNLRRGLLVTIQLIEMGVPLTLALNMYDEAGERGISIDLKGFADAVGLNVIPTIATQGWNLDKISNVMALNRVAESKLRYPKDIETAIDSVTELLPEARVSRRSIAMMILSGDSTLDKWLGSKLDASALKTIDVINRRLAAQYSEPIGYLINRIRLTAADRLLAKVTSKKAASSSKIASFIGTYSMHPFWGIPLLLVVLYMMYQFVGVLGAGYAVDFVESFIFGEFINPWSARVVEYVFPSGLIHDLIVGPYGIITMAVTYAIAIVMPIVSFFFIFFSILEDSGYLPRLAIMVDKIFRLMGLNGKAVLPMVLGLGCDTMATMTTRILETKKERIIVTLLLALGVPCSAQLGVILGMLSSISLMATIVWMFSVILIIFFVGYLSSKIVPGKTSDFIMEVPPIRIPQMKNVLLKTVVRVEWYLKEALPLFVLGTLVLFTLDRTHALDALQVVTGPLIVGFLGLPIESTEAFLIGFLRRDYGAAGLLALQRNGMLDGVQSVVSLVTITLFVPCIANLFIIVKERGLVTAILITVFIFPFALLAGGVLNFILRAIGATF
jgi:ferrous iron transport protein B